MFLTLEFISVTRRQTVKNPSALSLMGLQFAHVD